MLKLSKLQRIRPDLLTHPSQLGPPFRGVGPRNLIEPNEGLMSVIREPGGEIRERWMPCQGSPINAKLLDSLIIELPNGDA